MQYLISSKCVLNTFQIQNYFCSNPCLPPLETLLLLTESPPFQWQDSTHWIPPSPSSPHLYRCTFLFFGILAFFGLTIKSNIPNLWPHRLISKIHLLCTFLRCSYPMVHSILNDIMNFLQNKDRVIDRTTSQLQ